jgi:hypothetical protein
MAKTGRSPTSATTTDPEDRESPILEPRPPRRGTQARTVQSTRASTIQTDSDADSDNEDFSEVLDDINPDAESQDSVDTTVLAEMGTGSQRFFSQADFCLVRLGQKVTGHYLLCGHLILECTRPRHKHLRAQDDRRGQEGFYHTTPNASNKVFDAIEDTLVTLEDKTAEQICNQVLLVAVGSQQKALDEAALKDRSSPVVGFDLTEQTPTPRSDLMRTWRDAAPPPRGHLSDKPVGAG